MKKILCVLFIVLLLPVVVLSEEYLPLNDFEKDFVGGWAMYAKSAKGTVYHYSLTFTEDRSVYYRTFYVKNGETKYNEVASGLWAEFMSNTIILTLAGKTFVADFKDDLLRLIEYDTMALTGSFSRCPDLGYLIGE